MASLRRTRPSTCDSATSWPCLRPGRLGAARRTTGDEIAFGLVGKFWRPVIDYAPVTAAEFRAFAELGYAKTIYLLSVRALDTRRRLLSGTMRTATTDEHARRWFRRYWTFGVGSGAHVLVNGLIDVVRENAEQVQTAS